MQTAPVSEATNLILSLDSASARTPAARDFDTPSGQAAQPKAGNSTTPDRHSAGNETPRQARATSEAAAADQKPASRTRTPGAKTKEAAGSNAVAGPRSTVAGNEVPADGPQAATTVISEACEGMVFAAVLQQVGQAQAAQMAGAATPMVASGQEIAVPVKGQGPSVQPSIIQGQMLRIKNVVAPSQTTPTPPQQKNPQTSPGQVTEQTPLPVSTEAKPGQARSSGSNEQPTPTVEAKPLEVAIKPAAPAEHPAVAATVSPLQGQQQAAAMKAAAPDQGKVVEAYKTGQKQNGRRESGSTASTQATGLNPAQTTHGDAAAASRAADSVASVQSQTTATQGPINQASDHPPAKTAEPSVQSASRGGTQAEQTQQAAETPVADQIVKSIRAAGAKANQQIVVNLAPPELGKVRITFRSSGHEIRGVLETDNPDTLRRLEREAAGLTQRLGDAGLDVRRMDVVMTRQDGQTTSQNPHARDGGRQHPDAEPGSAKHADSNQAGPSGETSAAGMDAFASGGINVRI